MTRQTGGAPAMNTPSNRLQRADGRRADAAAASAPTTSSRCCCATASSSWARRSTTTVANMIVAQLLFLQQDDPERDIQLYINSPGGVARRRPGDLRHDAADRPGRGDHVRRHGRQRRARRLLAGGAKGKRLALPNSRMLIHQASAGVQGTAADIEVQAREILRLKRASRSCWRPTPARRRAHLARHQPRLLDERPRGQGVRPHRHDRRRHRRLAGRRPRRGREVKDTPARTERKNGQPH